MSAEEELPERAIGGKTQTFSHYQTQRTLVTVHMNGPLAGGVV